MCTLCYYQHSQLADLHVDNYPYSQFAQYSLEWPDHRRCMSALGKLPQFLSKKNPFVSAFKDLRIKHSIEGTKFISLTFGIRKVGYDVSWTMKQGPYFQSCPNNPSGCCAPKGMHVHCAAGLTFSYVAGM